jgi:lipopolysaccharide biosynthesis protein
MHVFYPDLFGELVSYAQNFGGSLGGAHINVVDSVWTPSVHKNVRELTPDAFVMMSANSGRDIGGFLRLLDHVHISRYELFAFMHTKKSPHVAAAKAEYWRRRLLNAFAGNKSIAQDCIRRFKDDPSIGLIACADWKENDIGKNAAQFTRILDLLEIDDDHREIEYVSGTMFLIRSEIVRRLYEKLRTVEFESGDNQTLEFNMDGQVAHSIERAIGNLVRQLGYRIEWVSQ